MGDPLQNMESRNKPKDKDKDNPKDKSNASLCK